MAKAKKSEVALTLEEKLEQTLVADWEQPYKVPDNWCWTTLKNISNLYNGDRGSNYPSKKDYVTEGVPFINAGAIQNNTLEHIEFNYITQQKYESLRAGKIQKNDILYCLRGSLGKTAIIETDIMGAISSSLCIIRTKKDVLPKYLAYLLRTELITQQQDFAENGSAQPNLSAASVMEYKLPLAPLAEQQRIVDRIERMFSKLDEVKENVQNVINGFENRKSAILHKAFNGELTAKWRKENHISINEWSRTTIGNILKVSSGKGLTAKNMVYTGKIPVYGGNGITGYHNESNVSPDTIVIGRVGYYCGSVHYISEPAWVTDNALIVSFDKKTIYTRFLMYLLSYANLRQNDSSTAQPVISGNKIYPISICMLPITEQKEMVRILDVLFAKEQQAKEKAEKVLERTELIKKSILARAFRGDLGTNNPDEESSIELLKTVLSEDKNEKRVTKPKSKRVSIPVEVKAMLSNHLEKDILKLFYKAESNEVSIDDIMSVSSNKFEIMDALKALEEKKLVSKKANGIYKLAR